MKKLMAMVFVLGLTLSSVSFASEDQSGGDCKNKASSSVSKEEVLSLTDPTETDLEEPTAETTKY